MTPTFDPDLFTPLELYEAARADLGLAPLLGVAIIALVALWLARRRKTP